MDEYLTQFYVTNQGQQPKSVLDVQRSAWEHSGSPKPAGGERWTEPHGYWDGNWSSESSHLARLGFIEGYLHCHQGNKSGRRAGFWSLVSLRQRRAPRPLTARHVPDILQILDPDFAGIKPVAGHPPQKREERHALTERVIFFRILPVSDQVQNLLLLFRHAFHERFSVLVDAMRIQPHQPAAQRQLNFFVFAG